MKKISRYTVWMAAFAGWALLLAACSSGKNGCMDEVQPDTSTATLILHTALLDKTRAVDISADNSVEYMYTLRIVVLHADGSVEHNVYVDFGNFPQTECFRILEVTRNETKKIYLIANEESVSSELHGKLETLTVGDNTFRSIVDELYFTPDYRNPIPMSSVYDVPVNAESLVERQFYLVRAATKFAFHFTNERENAVSVDAITISGIVGTTYLIPHKKEKEMLFEDEQFFWIDWMKKVADESQKHPEDVTLADRRGWIQDYDIPSGQAHEAVIVRSPTLVPGLTYHVNEAPTPGEKMFPVFYLPESKNLKNGMQEYGEQAYTMTLHLTEKNLEGETGTSEEKEVLFSRLFPNLKALFRNTHILVDVTFWEEGVKVDVIPYSEVVLNPDFGL